MNAGFLDMLHDAANGHVLPSQRASTSTSTASAKIAVDEHWTIAGDHDRLAHVAIKACIIAHDLHGATTEDVGRAHHDRVSRFAR
jgi:hypothetical protein